MRLRSKMAASCLGYSFALPVSQLRDWSTAALRNKLTAQGLYPVAMCGEEYGVYLRKQYEEYGRIIREANIKAQ